MMELKYMVEDWLKAHKYDNKLTTLIPTIGHNDPMGIRILEHILEHMEDADLDLSVDVDDEEHQLSFSVDVNTDDRSHLYSLYVMSALNTALSVADKPTLGLLYHSTCNLYGDTYVISIMEQITTVSISKLYYIHESTTKIALINMWSSLRHLYNYGMLAHNGLSSTSYGISLKKLPLHYSELSRASIEYACDIKYHISPIIHGFESAILISDIDKDELYLSSPKYYNRATNILSDMVILIIDTLCDIYRHINTLLTEVFTGMNNNNLDTYYSMIYNELAQTYDENAMDLRRRQYCYIVLIFSILTPMKYIRMQEYYKMREVASYKAAQMSDVEVNRFINNYYGDNLRLYTIWRLNELFNNIKIYINYGNNVTENYDMFYVKYAKLLHTQNISTDNYFLLNASQPIKDLLNMLYTCFNNTAQYCGFTYDELVDKFMSAIRTDMFGTDNIAMSLAIVNDDITNVKDHDFKMLDRLIDEI